MIINPNRKPMRVVSYSSVLKARAASAENATKPKISKGIKKLGSTEHLPKSLTGKNRPLEYQLLSNALKVFKHHNCDKLRTRDLIVELCADPSSPWCKYNKGQQITARQLGGLLKTFGVTSHDLYFAEGNAKGYFRNEIRKAYKKYKESMTTVTPIKHLK